MVPPSIERDTESEPQASLAWSSATLFGMHDAPMSDELLELFPKGGAFVVETRYSTDLDWLGDLGARTTWARTHGFEPIVRVDYARPEETTYADGVTKAPGATIPPPGEVGWCLARAGGGPSRDAGGEHLDCYLAYLGDAVSLAPDAHTWVIGNEMNLSFEAVGFDDDRIPVARYAEVYRAARTRIRSVPGHEGDVVLVGAVAPRAAGKGAYVSGKDYLTSLLYALQPDEVDGLALHAYGGWARPCDNGGVAPLESFESGTAGALGYQSQARWIDALGFSRSRLLLTEMSAHAHVTHGPGHEKCNDKKLLKGGDAYLVDRDELADFVRAAYASLHAWNANPANHDIAGGVWFTYRDPNQYASESLRHVHDLMQAEGLGSSPADNPYMALRDVALSKAYPAGKATGFGTCVASAGGSPLHPDGAPFSLRGALRDAWKSNGGRDVFGYPIEEAACRADARGRVLHAQHTQRARLEFHPELAGTPYQVSYALLGRALASQHGVDPDAWSNPGAPHAPGCKFIGPTPDVGHYVCGRVLAHWQSHGVFDPSLSPYDRSLRLFGYPVSPPVVEDGRTVQWFERARLELHDENAPPYDVLGGLLGCEASGSVGWGCQ